MLSRYVLTHISYKSSCLWYLMLWYEISTGAGLSGLVWAIESLKNKMNCFKMLLQKVRLQILSKWDYFWFSFVSDRVGRCIYIFVCSGIFPMLLRTKEVLPKFFRISGVRKFLKIFVKEILFGILQIKWERFWFKNGVDFEIKLKGLVNIWSNKLITYSLGVSKFKTRFVNLLNILVL